MGSPKAPARLRAWLTDRPLTTVALGAAIGVLVTLGGVALLSAADNAFFSPAEDVAADASATASSARAEDGEAAAGRLALDSNQIEFGRIGQNGEAEYLLTVSNTGDGPLAIEKVEAS